MRESSERRLVAEGLCPKTIYLLRLPNRFNCLLRCQFEIKPCFFARVPPYQLVISKLLYPVGIS